MKVSKLLTDWYSVNKRHLPWREDRNPYKIWISEIILQQTRVSQGMPYYYRFINRFPTVKDLALARLDDILVEWEGLGYYTRARNLHKAAQVILNKHRGVFPDLYENIISLPGIGGYTAAAIASLAYNLPYAAVDGNVYRVLARYLGITTPINTSLGKKQFQTEADKLLDKNNAGEHNQAIIELGALICLPAKPACLECPLQKGCNTFKNGNIKELPVKVKKGVVRSRYFYYLVIQGFNTMYIRQRKTNDIWRMLYEFPVIEFSNEVSMNEITESKLWLDLFENQEVQINKISAMHRHKLSHQLIHAWFIEVRINNPLQKPELKAVTESSLSEFAFPRLLVTYIQSRSQ